MSLFAKSSLASRSLTPLAYLLPRRPPFFQCLQPLLSCPKTRKVLSRSPSFLLRRPPSQSSLRALRAEPAAAPAESRKSSQVSHRRRSQTTPPPPRFPLQSSPVAARYREHKARAGPCRSSSSDAAAVRSVSPAEFSRFARASGPAWRPLACPSHAALRAAAAALPAPQPPLCPRRAAASAPPRARICVVAVCRRVVLVWRSPLRSRSMVLVVSLVPSLLSYFCPA